MERLLSGFKDATGKEALSIEKITGSGSNRKYFRLKNESNSLIGVIGESKEENIAFVKLSEHFSSKGLPVPSVIFFSDDNTHYLQEDLGDNSLFDFIKPGREKGIFSEEENLLLKKTIKQLAKIQHIGAIGLDFSCCYPVEEFDRRTIFWDLNYFKYYFLNPSGISFSEKYLEDDFEKIASLLLKNSTDTFLYRDFQSRNVIIKNNSPYFIDFQGGRKGPIYYDIASFLWQAKANFSDELRMELLCAYLEETKKYGNTFSSEEFMNTLKNFVLFRTLQVLGAYGYRGFFEKKQHFLESIPFALKNLNNLLQSNNFNYLYITGILKKLCLNY